MWPWEHLAVGYLLYSTITRLHSGESPTTAATLAVAFGTQFPDLVDKPLSWGLAVLESGVSVAHSIFTAVGLSLAVVALTRRLDRPRMGTAFAVGYLSHLPADAAYGVMFGNPLQIEPFLWPFVEGQSAAGSGFLDNVLYYAVRFVFFLATERGLAFLSLEVLLLSFTAWLWVRDGCPGVPTKATVPDHW